MQSKKCFITVNESLLESSSSSEIISAVKKCCGDCYVFIDMLEENTILEIRNPKGGLAESIEIAHLFYEELNNSLNITGVEDNYFCEITEEIKDYPSVFSMRIPFI